MFNTDTWLIFNQCGYFSKIDLLPDLLRFLKNVYKYQFRPLKSIANIFKRLVFAFWKYQKRPFLESTFSKYSELFTLILAFTCVHLLQKCMSIEPASIPILKINSINCTDDRRYCTYTATVRILHSLLLFSLKETCISMVMYYHQLKGLSCQGLHQYPFLKAFIAKWPTTNWAGFISLLLQMFP